MIVNETTKASATSNPFTDVIRAAADATGVNFSYLFRQASVESGFNPTAQAPTSSARGLYQFTKDTWLKVIEQHGSEVGLDRESVSLRSGMTTPDERQRILDLRNNPEISTRMAAHHALDNARALKASGVTVSGPTELYLAHFLGSGGAAKFLKGLRENPNAPAASLLPQAAQANKTIFYSKGEPVSLAAIYERFDRKFSDGQTATASAVTVAQTTLAAARTPSQSTLIASLSPPREARAVSLGKADQRPQSRLTNEAIGQRLGKTHERHNPEPQSAESTPSATTAMPSPKTLPKTPVVRLPQQQPAPAPVDPPMAAQGDAPVSVDTLAKFLDRASQWSTDAGSLDLQSKKGVMTRAATEGLRNI